VTKPYYQDKLVTHYHGDCLEGLPSIESGSIDLIATDPPYGIEFMGKDWDKAVPSVAKWKECLRVLKPGAFAFVLCIPRQDCLAKMICNLSDAGFDTGFTSMYWTYASGFPKAGNIGKQVDKRNGAKREVIGENPYNKLRGKSSDSHTIVAPQEKSYLTTPATPQAKALDGSYAGFNPKPAVEVILVAMKPLSEKTYVDQALQNSKGISWLDDCRIPIENTKDTKHRDSAWSNHQESKTFHGDKYNNLSNTIPPQGRFPANLICSDDVLNDGRVSKGSHNQVFLTEKDSIFGMSETTYRGKVDGFGDSGSYSRYFDLDAWYNKTFPFFICPKASKSEKNKGCEGLVLNRSKVTNFQAESVPYRMENGIATNPKALTYSRNNHPTVKPLKLMSYLITLGSRAGDTVLDPFLGSGTTCVAAKMLGRKCIGYEIDESYLEIAAKRCSQEVQEVMELKC